MSNQIEKKKRRKVILIVVIVDLILVGGGVLLFMLLMKGETPEELAKRVMDAAYEKDWKTIIYQTPDDVFDMLMNADAEAVKEKGITTSEELRLWALDHADEIPDPMGGKTIKSYRIGECETMPPSKYIEYYLGGEGDNAYYPFLRKKDQIAVVQIYYTVVDGDQETERTDTVVEYKKDGAWYSLTGVQVIDSMLRTN